MYENMQNQYGQVVGGGFAVDRQRVLRNTYWLLALSMIPTVLGAWVGLATGVVAAMGAGPATIMFFIGAFGLMFVIEKTKNSSAGVYALLGFTFFMGLMLSQILSVTLRSYSNGAQLIMMAFGGTGAIFFAMASLATIIKRDLSAMGKFLFIGVVILLVASLVSMFMHSSALMLTVMVMSMAIFSAFMLYDVKRIIDGGETNYISATLNIYLDLYNVFQSLLSLLGIFGGDRR